MMEAIFCGKKIEAKESIDFPISTIDPFRNEGKEMPSKLFGFKNES